MPINHQGERAIRAIRGDVNGTPYVANDHSEAANIEFIRIYKGSDLKFDRWNETHLCFNNDTSSAMSLSFMKYGTSWSSDVVVKWISSSNLNTENTMTLSAGTEYTGTSGTNTITVPANGRVYICNGNSSQKHFCESDSCYITIYSNRSFHVTGNWLALVPGTKQVSSSQEQGQMDSYAFHRLFQNCTSLTAAPDLDRKVNGQDIGSRNSSGYGYGVFSYMFDGCTSLTHAPALHFDCSKSYSIFAYAFQNCTSITSVGDVFISDRGNSYHILEGTYKGCTRLLQGPSIQYPGTLDDHYMYRTFYGCSVMTSIRDLLVKRVFSSGMEETFCNCTNFTGDGLSVNYVMTASGAMNKSYVADIHLYGSRSLYRTFYGCTSMTKIFGQYFDPNYQMIDSYLIAFQIRQDTSAGAGYRMYQTFYGCSSLSRGSVEHIRMSDMTNSSSATYQEYDFFECFRGCTSLNYIQNLFSNAHPETSGNSAVAIDQRGSNTQHVCDKMFFGCSSMTSFNMPKVNASGGYSFSQMFSGCTSLQRAAGTLPASLTRYDFYKMFFGCTSLISGPVIMADGHGREGSFQQMFYNCSSLKYIVANLTSFDNTDTYQWTYGTTDGGNGSNARYFIAINSASAFSSSNCNASGNVTANNSYRIPYGWVIYNSPIVVSTDSSATVYLRKNGTPTGTHTFTYINLSSGQNGTYVPGTTQNGAITSSGPFVIWGTSNNGQLSTDDNNYYYFRITGSASVYGDPANLCKPTGTLSTGSYRFYRLFYNCTGITDASGINGLSGTVGSASYQYAEMFRNCTKLESAPDISFSFGSSGSWTCYKMFNNCTALAAPPDLSGCTSIGATGVFCSMFEGCTSLGSVASLPSASNFTLGQETLEAMYRGCTSLTEIPIGYLPWTSLAAKCYLYMFANCSGISVVPLDLLPATNFTGADLCYSNMFENCTSMTEAPDLLATDTKNVQPYCRIFSGCTSLQRIKVSFTAWKKGWGMSDRRDTQDWTKNLPTSGYFYCSASLPDYRNNSTNTGNSQSVSDGCTDASACYIPYGWTLIRDSAPNWFDLDGMIVMERASGTVTIAPNGTRGQQLEYTLDGLSWNRFTSAVTVNSSQTKVGFRAGTDIVAGQYPGTLFAMSGTGKVNVSGNVTRCYRTNRTAPTDASGMFQGCQHISNCNGLYFKAPYIKANSMFRESSVTSVRSDLICTHYTISGESNFESMFNGCNSLQYGTDLYTMSPVKKLDFVFIYQNCPLLHSHVAIGEPVSGGTCNSEFAPGADYAFAYAFYGCTNIAAVDINFNYLGKATDGSFLKNTFTQCFMDCTSLSAVYSKQMRWPVLECCYWWLYNTGSSNSKFYKYPGNGLVTQRGNSRIPYGWSVIDNQTWI